MFHGLYWLAANVASYLPTVLLIDDLHWADTPSLRWLSYLARRLEGVPLLVIAAMRPPDQGREPELLTELLADPEGTAIRPGPLTVDAIAALVRRRFEEDGDPEFNAAVETATRGNPLFTLALLDTVAREKLPPRADQAHRLLELGPQVVGRAVALRLARLPEGAVALIEAAAILGDGAELREAGVLAGLDDAATANAARVLLRSDLLIRDDPIEFFHPVVRSAIYEDLDTVARSDGHRRAAELRLEAGVPPEQAAAHLMLVNRGADPFVVETLRTAAQRSLARGAPEAAVAYLTRALEERIDDALRGELLAELGVAEGRIDGRASAEHLEAGGRADRRPGAPRRGRHGGRACALAAEPSPRGAGAERAHARRHRPGREPRPLRAAHARDRAHRRVGARDVPALARAHGGVRPLDAARRLRQRPHARDRGDAGAAPRTRPRARGRAARAARSSRGSST